MAGATARAAPPFLRTWQTRNLLWVSQSTKYTRCNERASAPTAEVGRSAAETTSNFYLNLYYSPLTWRLGCLHTLEAALLVSVLQKGGSSKRGNTLLIEGDYKQTGLKRDSQQTNRKKASWQTRSALRSTEQRWRNLPLTSRGRLMQKGIRHR